MPITNALCVWGGNSMPPDAPWAGKLLEPSSLCFWIVKSTLNCPGAPPCLCPLRERGRHCSWPSVRCLGIISSQPSVLLKTGSPLYTTLSTSSPRTLSQFLPQWREAMAHTHSFLPHPVFGWKRSLVTCQLPNLSPSLCSGLPWLLALTGWVDNCFFSEILSPVFWYTALLFFQPNCSFCFQCTSTMSFSFFLWFFFHCILSFADIQAPPLP